MNARFSIFKRRGPITTALRDLQDEARRARNLQSAGTLTTRTPSGTFVGSTAKGTGATATTQTTARWA